MVDLIMKEMSWVARSKSDPSTWAYAFVLSLIAGCCHSYCFDSGNFGLVTTSASVTMIFIVLVTLSFIAQRVLKFRQSSLN